MKNLFIISILFLISTQCFCQRKSVDLLNDKIGPVEWTFKRVTDLSKSDTTYYVWGGFQNFKYRAITDIKSVFITNQLELTELVSDMKLAYNEMNKKQTISWDKKSYSLRLYDFTDNLYLESSDQRGYTYLTQRQVEKTIMFLENIKFPK